MKRRLKILYVTTFHYPRGGPWTHYTQMKKILERQGHSVIPFSMHHPLNYPSEYSKYFVSYIDYAQLNKRKNIENAFKVLRAIYSFESRNKIKSLIEATKPDLCHIHAFMYHITPSILGVLKKYRIPIIYTPEDYNLLCPDTHFAYKGEICERCKGNKFYSCIDQRCKKDSLSASVLASVLCYIWNLMKWKNSFSKILTQTQFVADKFCEYGYDPRIIEVVQPSLNWDDFIPQYGDGNYLCYVGRLTPEKGVDVILEAANIAGDVPLRIVGDGFEREHLESKSRELRLKNVEFLGTIIGLELEKIVTNAIALIVPSKWYEILGFTILEAFGWGKPVIGSDIGAIPELVTSDKTGWLFPPGNARYLAHLMLRALREKDNIRSMGMEARRKVEEVYSEKNHYRKLMAAYESLI